MSTNHALTVFANAYVICRDYADLLVRMTRAESDTRREYEKELRDMLGALGAPSTLLLDRDSLRWKLSNCLWPVALRRTGALLVALSVRLGLHHLDRRAPVIATAGDGQSFWLSTIPRESPWHRAGIMPRQEDAVSEMLSTLLEHVHVTPLTMAHPKAHPAEIRPLVIAGTLARKLKRLGKRLSIAVCPMTTDMPIPRVTRVPAKGTRARFVIEGASNEQEQARFLKSILDQCRAEDVAILVLPELRISPRLRIVIEDWLRPQKRPRSLLMVIAGSWHVDDGGEYVNRTVVLDSQGAVLWTNDKLSEYNMAKKEVPDAFLRYGFDEQGGQEDIRVGRTLVVADTPLGRMTTAICAGFFQERARFVMEQSGANFFFVPAMTRKTSDLARVAESLTRLAGASFIANCAWAGGDGNTSFVTSFSKVAEKRHVAAKAGQSLLVWRMSDLWG